MGVDVLGRTPTFISPSSSTREADCPCRHPRESGGIVDVHEVSVPSVDAGPLRVIVANVDCEVLPSTVCGQSVVGRNNDGFVSASDVKVRHVSFLSEDVGDFESQQIGGDGTIESAKDPRKKHARVLGVFFPEKPLDGDRSVRDVEQRLTPVFA